MENHIFPFHAHFIQLANCLNLTADDLVGAEAGIRSVWKSLKRQDQLIHADNGKVPSSIVAMTHQWNHFYQ